MATVQPRSSSPYVLSQQQEARLINAQHSGDPAAKLQAWLHEVSSDQAQQVGQAAKSGSLVVDTQGISTDDLKALNNSLEKLAQVVQADSEASAGSAASASGGDQTVASANGSGVAGVTSDSQTADGYTVDDCVRDMKKLQNSDNIEGGTPKSDEQLKAIAQGIIKGINANFPNVQGKGMARELIASAWKESKFDSTLGNGGVFQCAQNRLDDYNKAHGTNITQDQLAGQDPSLGIAVSLWAMANPAPGLGEIADEPMPTDPGAKALYLWNYNDTNVRDGKPEIVDYMQKTRSFMQMMDD